MNNELTLEELCRQFEIAKDCMTSNLETINNPQYPNYATWIHHSTMVRWLYGSSQEFVQDFGKKALGFSGIVNDSVLKWKYELIFILDSTKWTIINKYSQHAEIMEALKK